MAETTADSDMLIISGNVLSGIRMNHMVHTERINNGGVGGREQTEGMRHPETNNSRKLLLLIKPKEQGEEGKF